MWRRIGKFLDVDFIWKKRGLGFFLLGFDENSIFVFVFSFIIMFIVFR